jgi:serine/threonine protein kinase
MSARAGYLFFLFMIGQTISHYRITGRLGSGGMGVVYEAQDLTLGRRVALKFLPPELARDASALGRFLLEARAASALNHPNICTIYAVENDGGQSFISMELIEGQGLDSKLHAGALPIDRLIDVSIQLADALDAAHAKGIVHRDIKPANIFITQRGQVKVLDFGLAKLTQAAGMAAETIGATQDDLGPAHLTSPGSTVGTIAYMSPEQARGEELDARTDLFSLGAVIYQMATGQLPFPGNTSALIFNAILERDPVPAAQLNPQLPPKLLEVIDKLLEKDRDLRYQSAADLRGDFRRLKRNTEPIRPATQPISAGSVSVAVPAASPSPQPSSGSAVVAAARQHKLGAGVAALIAVALIAAAVYGIYSLIHRNQAVPFQNISIHKVTETGKATLAAISPDGKYILNVMRENGQESLWLRNVPTNSNTQVIPPADADYLGLRFSPDGNYLYFMRSEPGSQELKYLYRAPMLGGTPQKLVTDIDTNISFSPDGREFAYAVYNNPEVGKYRLVIQSVENGDNRVLSSGPADSRFDDPAWSPDGKTIVGVTRPPGDELTGLTAVDVHNAQQRVFFVPSGSVLSLPVWLPDGSGLLVLARDQTSNFLRGQVGFVSYPEGKFRPVTRDANGYSTLSIASDGRTLASVLNESHSSIFLLSATSGSGGQVREIPSTSRVPHLSWTPEGQLVIDQSAVLSLLNLDSGAKTALANEPGFVAVQPSACADGRYIVFSGIAPRNGKIAQNIWRMDAAGGNLKQLTGGKAEQTPVCSPDGRSVLYDDEGNESKLSKVSIEGGASQRISDELMVPGFDISSDGKFVVLASFHHVDSHEEKLVLVDLSSGHEVKALDFERHRDGSLRFTHDGKAVVYPVLTGGADNLWLQPLDGSPGKQITDFKSELINDFHWSLDGSKLAIIRGHNDSDVVLIRDSQP